MRIGIDIDLVVAQSDLVWDKWIQEKCGLTESKLPKEDILYFIGLYYKEFLPEGLDILDFWRQENLYDNMPLVPKAKESIDILSQYYDIIFISTIKGNHHKSKYNFIKANFPYLKGFIATKEKYLVDVDIMIDDRVSNLEKFSYGKTTILFDTPYQQDDTNLLIYQHNHPFNKPRGWDQIVEDLTRYL